MDSFYTNLHSKNMVTEMVTAVKKINSKVLIIIAVLALINKQIQNIE